MLEWSIILTYARDLTGLFVYVFTRYHFYDFLQCSIVSEQRLVRTKFEQIIAYSAFNGGDTWVRLHSGAVEEGVPQQIWKDLEIFYIHFSFFFSRIRVASCISHTGIKIISLLLSAFCWISNRYFYFQSHVQNAIETIYIHVSSQVILAVQFSHRLSDHNRWLNSRETSFCLRIENWIPMKIYIQFHSFIHFLSKYAQMFFLFEICTIFFFSVKICKNICL